MTKVPTTPIGGSNWPMRRSAAPDSGGFSGERGSVLLLMPAAVLIVVVLASIAVDFTIAFLGEREAASLAAAAANDAVTAALDDERFRAGEGIHLDEDRARRVARSTLGASSSELDDVEVDVEVGELDGEPSVTVTVRGTIDYVFARRCPARPPRPSSRQPPPPSPAPADGSVPLRTSPRVGPWPSAHRHSALRIFQPSGGLDEVEEVDVVVGEDVHAGDPGADLRHADVEGVARPWPPHPGGRRRHHLLRRGLVDDGSAIGPLARTTA